MAQGLICGLFALLLHAGLGLAQAGPTQQRADRPDATGDTWVLTDTWSERPASVQPGHFRRVSDLSAGPSGTIYVLDGAQGVVHVFDPQGRPRRRLSVLDPTDAAARWVPRRLDLGPDGSLYLLSAALVPDAGSFLSRIDRYSSDGRRLSRFRLRSARPQPYRDLAVDGEGRILLTRIHVAKLEGQDEGEGLEDRGEAAIEIRDVQGQLLARRAPPALALPGNLARGPDGQIYVVNRVQPNLNLPGGEDPRPSLGHRPAEPPPDHAVEGVLIFDAALDLVAFHAFNAAQDLAAGPAGVFVSRGVEVFALGERAPRYTAPIGNAGAGAGDRLQLATLPGGRLAAGIDHCALQGLLLIDHPERRPATARLAEGSGASASGGPAYPVAVAADRGVTLLEGRFDREGAGPEAGLRASPQGSQTQTVQRWRQGMPVAQHGLCSGSGPWRARDLAMDGETVYALDGVTLRRFDTGPLPVWTRVPLDPDALRPAPYLIAIDADAGRVAVLDAARGELLLLGADGTELARWPAGDAEQAAGSSLPVDLAMDGERLLLADRGRRRILVYSPEGQVRASWRSLAPPARIASGPGGKTFVLGADGWVYVHSREGRPVAAWPLPDAGTDAQPEAYDIAVDADGRVLVSFARLDYDTAAPAWSLRMPSHPVIAAGVWVYQQQIGTVGRAIKSEPGGCSLRASSTARPARALTGQPIEIRLGLDGHCFATAAPAQVVLLLDISRSMGFRESLARARESLTTLLGMLERSKTELALIAFDERAQLILPLGSDASRFGPALAGLEPNGGTRPASGLAAALEILDGPNADPQARRSLLLITDGAFDEAPEAEAEALRAAGIELQVLAWVNEAFEPSRHLLALERVAGEGDRVWFAPRPEQLATLATALTGHARPAGWLDSLTVEVPLPAGLRYRPGSSRPAASYDPDAHRLLWTRGPVSAEQGLTLRFEVVADRPLRWPDGQRARLRYRDATGLAGSLDFPATTLEIVAPVDRLWLPSAGR